MDALPPGVEAAERVHRGRRGAPSPVRGVTLLREARWGLSAGRDTRWPEPPPLSVPPGQCRAEARLMPSPPLLFLAGPHGSGKSALGARACAELGLRFLDLSEAPVAVQHAQLDAVIAERSADVIALSVELQAPPATFLGSPAGCPMTNNLAPFLRVPRSIASGLWPVTFRSSRTNA